MTPAARVAAAIDCLDRIAAGGPAEKVLTAWARRNRYAGSRDRAAIRDHVFDALRCWRSAAWVGGGETGRARILGLLRMAGQDPATVFSGQGYAPPPLSDDEARAGRPRADAPETVRLDWPDWLMPETRQSLGPDCDAVLAASRHRAPVFLRVNIARISRDAARARLAEAGFAADPHPYVETALTLGNAPRGLLALELFTDGLIELQDAHSQAVVNALPLADGMRVLDFCAGGGGKTLALGARNRLDLVAHDKDPARMQDLSVRAARAGIEVVQIGAERIAQAGAFDLVLADAPCSGSGSWRRAPEGKWRLTPDLYRALQTEQARVLDAAAERAAPGGHLAYVTCSVLAAENAAQADAFLCRQTGWQKIGERQLLPGPEGDGFFLVTFRRNA